MIDFVLSKQKYLKRFKIFLFEDQFEKRNETDKILNTSIEEQTKLLAPVASLYSSADDNNNSDNLKQQAVTNLNPILDYPLRIPDAFPIGTVSNNGHNTISHFNPLVKSASLIGFQTRRSDTNELSLQKPSSKLLLGSLPARGAVSATTVSTPTACGHYNAGQELCYLCHQRSKRNVPIYLHEERKQKDAEEQQLLQQYQHVRDMEKQLQEEENDVYRRNERAKMDAFNIGVAEAIKMRKNDRPKTSDVSVS